jgi:host factor-I protein
MPGPGFDLTSIASAAVDTATGKKATLQDIFLGAVKKSGDPVTMFLVNGVMLQGEIAAFDLFCMLLERDRMVQLVYKHAVSTVQPSGPVNLMGEPDDESDD